MLQGAALTPQATIIEMSSGGMYNAPLTLGLHGHEGSQEVQRRVCLRRAQARPGGAGQVLAEAGTALLACSAT
jgi:hypothetical protein